MGTIDHIDAQISTSVAEMVEERVRRIVSELTKDTTKRVDKAVEEGQKSISTLEKVDKCQSKILDEILTLLKKEPVVAPTPAANFFEDDRKNLTEILNHERLSVNSFFRLRSQFSSLSKGLPDYLEQQSWKPLKNMKVAIVEYAKMPLEVPKGEKIKCRLVCCQVLKKSL